MKNIILAIVSILIILPFSVHSQVGIGTDTPKESAILDLESSDKGILIPRLQQSEVDDIADPAFGLLVFNSTFAKFQYYDGLNWLDIAIDLGANTPEYISNMDGDVFVHTQESLAEKNVKINIQGTEVATYRMDRVNLGANTKISDNPFDEPVAALDIDGRIKLTDEANVDAEEGTIRWNQDTQDFEGFTGTIWKSLTKSAAAYGNIKNTIAQESLMLTSNDGDEDDLFTAAISISEEYAVISAAGKENKGYIYVYEKVNNGWEFLQSMTGSATQSNSVFGESVAISGEYIMVGSLETFNANVGQGVVYVFKLTNGLFEEVDIITADDGSANDQFGISIAIDNNTMVVGAINAEVNNQNNAGAIYVYVLENGDWNFQAKLTASNVTAWDFFGFAIDIHGDRIVATADPFPFEDGEGTAYTYIRTGSIWNFEVALQPSISAIGSRFGISVALDDDDLLVGASYHDLVDGTENGVVHHYRSDNNMWQPVDIFTSEQKNDFNTFGHKLSLHNEILIVGTEFANEAYVFKQNDGISFKQELILESSDNQSSSSFGKTVAVNSNFIFIGDPNKNVNGNSNQGKIYIYNNNQN